MQILDVHFIMKLPKSQAFKFLVLDLSVKEKGSRF